MSLHSTNTRSRWWWAANAITGLTLALALMLMANLLARRHAVRADWSAGRTAGLSSRTLTLLADLQESVQVLACFRTTDPLLRPVRNLLREYAMAAPNLQITFVDPDRDLLQAKTLAPYLRGLEPNVVIFRNAKRSVVVHKSDLALFDDTPMLIGRPQRLLLFKGENAFSSALQRIQQENEPVVYFLTGHGERGIDDYDPAFGYSDLARRLRRLYIEPRTLFFGESDTVPSDADAVVIAGPTQPLTAVEQTRLRDYLERGGRLMVLLDLGSHSDLEPLLEEWGVRVGSQRVVDATLTGREILIRRYSQHPAMASLAGITTIFNLPRPVQPVSGSAGIAPVSADRPTVNVLAWTSDTGFATPDLDNAKPSFNEETDLHGPISLAAAVERGPAPELKVELAPARLVVAGDSTLAANGALRQGYNIDFFMAAMNWLLERSQILPIDPRQPDNFRIILEQPQFLNLFWLWVIIFPAAVGFAGCLVRRQRQRESRGAWRS